MNVDLMNVSLTPDLAAFVRDLVAGGEYTGQSEVVCEGLRLLKDQEEIRSKERRAVRAKIERGWQQSERGEVVTAEQVREHFTRKSAERRGVVDDGLGSLPSQ